MPVVSIFPFSVAPFVFSGLSMPDCGAGPVFCAMTGPEIAASAIAA
ncbi:hypothetical protein ACVIIV_005656 [Bradyrhizobium sp. USDA 4354]